MTFLGQLSPLEEDLGYKWLVREGGRSGKGKKIGKAPTVHYDQFGHNIVSLPLTPALDPVPLTKRYGHLGINAA